MLNILPNMTATTLGDLTPGDIQVTAHGERIEVTDLIKLDNGRVTRLGINHDALAGIEEIRVKEGRRTVRKRVKVYGSGPCFYGNADPAQMVYILAGGAA